MAESNKVAEIMDLWNMKDLEPPPINSAKADLKEIDMKLLKNVLRDAIDFFKNQQHLNIEAALLSRTIYRMKMKFRSSKDFKALEKLNRALKVYLQIQIPQVLKTFANSVPVHYKPNVTYLPTKHMMDFVLVRLQSLGKVLVRILETCKVAYTLSQQRLHVGHFWKIGIIFHAMIARFFVITKGIIKYTCDLYTNLFPFSSKLSGYGNPWLPNGYVLPESLSEWLDIDWIDLETTVIEIVDDEPTDMSYFHLIEDSDDDDLEFCDEYVVVKDENSYKPFSRFFDDTETIEVLDDTAPVNFIDDNEDIGEEIDPTDAESYKSQNEEENSQSSLPDSCEEPDVGEVITLDDTRISNGNETVDLDDKFSPNVKVEDDSTSGAEPVTNKRTRQAKKKNKTNSKTPESKWRPVPIKRAIKDEDEIINLDDSTNDNIVNKIKLENNGHNRLGVVEVIDLSNVETFSSNAKEERDSSSGAETVNKKRKRKRKKNKTNIETQKSQRGAVGNRGVTRPATPWQRGRRYGFPTTQSNIRSWQNTDLTKSVKLETTLGIKYIKPKIEIKTEDIKPVVLIKNESREHDVTVRSPRKRASKGKRKGNSSVNAVKDEVTVINLCNETTPKGKGSKKRKKGQKTVDAESPPKKKKRSSANNQEKKEEAISFGNSIYVGKIKFEPPSPPKPNKSKKMKKK